ncbi:MAG TPA: RHS repeat-associated core domain-containing protein [Caulobacteraceae bacterium]|nr:RHS repeat-associated core domain-containing protein [Caulobacteraceae bacterium]
MTDRWLLLAPPLATLICLLGANVSQARFLQPDPAGLKQGPNLYEYAADDPVNGKDPLGLYTCSGTSTQCGAISKVLANDKTAASALPAGSKGQNALKAVLKFYGKANDPSTGVNFSFNKSGLSVENMAGTHIEVGINLKEFSDTFSGRSDGSMPASELAAAVAHEGQQGMDDRARGSGSWRRSEVYQSERHGFETQSYVNQGLGVPSGYGVWRPGISPTEQNRAFDSNAERATNLDCKQGTCAPN